MRCKRGQHSFLPALSVSSSTGHLKSESSRGKPEAEMSNSSSLFTLKYQFSGGMKGKRQKAPSQFLAFCSGFLNLQLYSILQITNHHTNHSHSLISRKQQASLPTLLQTSKHSQRQSFTTLNPYIQHIHLHLPILKRRTPPPKNHRSTKKSSSVSLPLPLPYLPSGKIAYYTLQTII